MRLPNLYQAVVSEEKIAAYLLNPQHPDGAPKAAFFTAMGFSRADWLVLAAALRQVAEMNDVAGQLESAHGTKYIVDGLLDTPSGRTPRVRTVWIVDHGATVPRLVTAYPRAEGE
jgi:hypothetical protein